MKTQILTTCGYRIAMLVSLLIGYPTYAVSNDNHLFFNASYFLQDKQQKGIIKLSGTVKDAQGVLGGVIVSVGNKTVATDLDGKYSIDVTVGDRITFSMLGYKERSIVYSSSMGAVLNIELLEDTTTLDEIVVNAGYYTVKDRERTGSIARVTAKDIEFQPVVNPLQALQGRMAGVSITQYSGTPGGGFEIQIRGKNSLSFDGNEPLYIIDGVPIVSQYLNGFLSAGILNTKISPLNSINPNDIESIEILKDADATAIYGSRGANGVILITTKKASKSTTQLVISSSTSFSKAVNQMSLLNTEEFNKLREEAFINDGITDYPVNAYDMNGTWDKNRYTDWQKELIGNTAVGHETLIGLSGGSQTTSFRLNTSLTNNSTIFPTDKGYKRNAVSFNINHLGLDSKLRANIGVNYALQKNNLPAVDFTKTALNLAPNAPALYKEDGSLNWQDGTFANPLAQLDKTYNNQTKSLSLNANFDYNLTSEVSLKVNLGLTSSEFDENVLSPHTIFNPGLGFTSERSRSEKGFVNSQSYIIEPQLNWQKKWNKHSLIMLIGSTFENQQNNSFKITGSNFSSNALIKNIEAAKVKTIDNLTNSQYKYAAVFTRINYNFDSKYIVNLTGRRDGSSRFGYNNKFGNFGAFGVAWVFSEENYLRHLPWLNLAKIRSSYGITGSDNIGDYQYLDTYTVNKGKYDEITGLYPSRLLNADFGWEKTTKFELALDLTFLHNKINASLQYYNNKSSNQLVGYSLPWTTGFASITSNFPATVVNNGWEFTLNTNNIDSKDWNWQTNFNISFPKNKLKRFKDLEDSTYKNKYVLGKSINIVKLYHLEGVNPQSGLYEFTDYNQDGHLTADDKQITKEIGITFHGGLQNTITYKNLSLDFLFHFVKQQNYNYDALYKYIGDLQTNLPIQMLDRWSKDNIHAKYTYASSGTDSSLMNLYNRYIESDRTISDASFIRLKNVSVSYNFNLPNKGIDSVKIYIQGQNLWTHTNYYGLDPEFVLLGFSPPLKTYAFGAQITF
ncbi:SusC/RagA family TonB-linked outer membrane protein [Myroides pelagicus]|uniref:SusC/RagA family TonB-linked outer membrane protein n=1 Tax=Myroides pelagicus TaxID=270914 RepID=A0A7K1GN65_9FLAO|nr:SusC/RagA family TonB-linked outer membrane protein [Myroides pelagicus]MTH30342.1 SusC/RagA family TonB-linked outer membrane protein [Myroides pelagicus]